MANEIQFKRGNSNSLSNLDLKPGEPAFTLDDGKLYIGSDGGNTCINPSLGTAAQKDVGTAVGNVVEVQADGKLAKAIIPALDIIDAGTIVGKLGIECLPAGALERLIVVADDAARFALTIAQTQSGDTVKVTATGLMYFIVDDTKLSTEDGYETYTAGSATAVPWSGVTGKPTTLAGYNITDAANATHAHTVENVTSLQTALDAKAALASPALTGAPTAPTATASDNSTKLATTAFVKAQGYLNNASVLDGGTF